MLRRREFMADRGELPAGYKPCRYLQGGSTKYIDTGIYAEISDTVKPVISIKCEILPNIKFNQRIFGSTININSFFQFFINADAADFGIQAFNSPPLTTFTKDMIEHTYVFDFAQKKPVRTSCGKRFASLTANKISPCFYLPEIHMGKPIIFFTEKYMTFHMMMGISMSALFRVWIYPESRACLI